MSRWRRSAQPIAGRLSSDATPANPMTDEQRIARAVAVANCEIAVKLCAAAERRTGRPRLIPLPGVLAAYIFHASGEPHTMTTSAVCRSVKKLEPRQRAALGIPMTMQIKYKRMHSGWRAIKRVVEHGVLVDHDHDLDVDLDTGEVLACPESCPFEQVSLDVLLTLLIQASLPPEFERPPAVAIDGTDVERFARAHKRQIDAHGRSFYSFDRDARDTGPARIVARLSTSSDMKAMSARTPRPQAASQSPKSPPDSRCAPETATASRPA